MAAHQRANARREVGRADPEAHQQPKKQRNREHILRYVLGVVAGTEIVLGLVAMVVGAQLHPARELAAADFAFAVGCLVAAVQPRRALGIWPVAAALIALIIGTGMFDLLRGVAGPLSESHHAMEIAGAVILGLLARQTSRNQPI
jgi:predicted anti-sigma-YlaC factor YlaD